jgi:hypothetical protein
LLITVIVIAGIVNNVNRAAQKEVVALGTQLSELGVITAYNDTNPVGNNVTATVIAETDLITASYLRVLADVYPAIDPENSLSEEDVSAIAELNGARARGNLDNAYAEVLRSQLLSTCDQIEILQESASDVQKESLSKAYDDFQELARRLPATAT